jgi:uncharacterized protein YciI
MHFLLFYHLAPDYLDRRPAFRDEHLTLAWKSQARGDLVLAGALADPPDRAVFLFRADSPAPAEYFAEADPYVKNALVTSWEVRPWTTVIGTEATTPLRPTR